MYRWAPCGYPVSKETKGGSQIPRNCPQKVVIFQVCVETLTWVPLNSNNCSYLLSHFSTLSLWKSRLIDVCKVPDTDSG